MRSRASVRRSSAQGLLGFPSWGGEEEEEEEEEVVVAVAVASEGDNDEDGDNNGLLPGRTLECEE